MTKPSAPKRAPGAKAPASRTYRPRAPKQLGDIAVVTLMLDRSTGEVSIEQELSTPAETWFTLTRAKEMMPWNQDESDSDG